MKIDVDFDKKSQSALVTFFKSEFQKDYHYPLALNILATFAADFELDPEIEADDLKEIISGIDGEEKTSLVFFINEDGIEAETR